MILHQAYRNVKRPVTIAMLLVLCVGSLAAQPTTDWADRQALRSALNSALATLLARHVTGRDSEAVVLSGIGDIVLTGLNGTCDTLRASNPADSLNRITLIQNDDDDDYVTLRVPTRGPTIIKVAPGSHPMVCDLNGWLWTTWGMDFPNSTHPFWHGNDDDPGDRYPVPGDACAPVGQQFYMLELKLDEQGYLDTLERYSGAGPYLWGRYYVVPEDGGDTMRQLGVHFYKILRPNDRLTLIGRHPVGSMTNAQDTARPAYVRFERDMHSGVVPPPSGVKELLGFSIIAHTQQYSPDECPPAFLTGPGPLSGKAEIELVIDYKESGIIKQKSCTWDFNTSTADVNNLAMWEQFDNKNGELGNNFVQKWGKFEVDSAGYLFFYTFGGGALPCYSANDTFYLFRIRDPNVPAEYCEMTVPNDGNFCLDDMTGKLQYNPNTNDCPCTSCTPIQVTCLDFCEPLSGYLTMTGVIGASASVLKDDWPYDPAEFGSSPEGSNRYEKGEDAQWRPERSFVYKSRIRSGNENASTPWYERNYADAGVFVNVNDSLADAFRLFNWKDVPDNPTTSWIRVDSVTAFSPFSEPVEQSDILGVYSAARFAHQNTVPKLVARNARYGSVDFESFEDGMGTSPDTAHTGRWSLMLKDDGSWSDAVGTIVVDQQVLDEGVLVKAWVKRTYLDYEDSEIPIKTSIAPSSDFVRVAQTGEWTLYELQLSALPGSPALNDVLDLKFANNLDQTNASDHVWIDDIRVQPLFSEMVCYVYDAPTLRLIAQFDDQHFARLFQYNGEGKLVRKLVETERGIKTIAETQYHTPEWLTYAGGTPMTFRGGGSGAGSMLGGGNGATTASGSAGSGTGATFDLLNVEIGPDGADTKVLGSENPELPDLENLSMPQLPSTDILHGIDTTALKLPDVGSPSFRELPTLERLKLIGRAHDLDRSIRLSGEKLKNAETDEEREQAEKELEQLREERRKLVENELGVSEEELHRLYQDLKLEGTDTSEQEK